MEKKRVAVALMLLMLIFSISLVSAGWFDDFTDFLKDLFSIGKEKPIKGEVGELPSLSATSINEGLISYWKFENNVQDSQGNYDGTSYGNPQFVSGKVNSALSFDGVDDYVSVADSSDWTFGNEFTIALWVKIKAEDSYGPAFVSHDEKGGPSNKWIFLRPGKNSGAPVEAQGKTAFHIYNLASGADWVYGDLWTLNSTKWYYLAITKKGTNYTFYRNGVKDGSDTSSLAIPNAAASLQIAKAESVFKFNGIIDEVKIWNYALSAEEVKEEYVNVVMPASCVELKNSLTKAWHAKCGDINYDTRIDIASSGPKEGADCYVDTWDLMIFSDHAYDETWCSEKLKVQECTDSDSGLNYYIKGTTSGIEWSTPNYVEKIDFCEISGPKTGFLVEYYCDNNQLKFVSYNCSSEGKICQDGICIKCTENWRCGEWSGCIEGQQTRTCTDLNNCGTEENKPIKTQTCCTPNCAGKQCGDDNCGGSCGKCGIGFNCISEKCIEACIDNDNDNYFVQVVSGNDCGSVDCNDNNANINPGKKEICGNNIDEDCDGSIDENCSCLTGANRTCGTTDVGECKKGVQSCVNSSWEDCKGNIESKEEICDNKDNDCDGEIDENIVRTCGTTDVGECRSGIEMCSAGEWIGCNSIGPIVEVCKNEKDDNCDGIVDEEDCTLECEGCLYNKTCFKVGFRLTIDSLVKYCDNDKEIKLQKKDDESCQNNYECLSNQCSDGVCVGLVEEIRRQTSLLWKILCTLLHPISEENRQQCIEERSIPV